MCKYSRVKLMSRLIAFGCSNTLGEGLPDCRSRMNPKHSRPSSLAWPSCLAQLLGCKTVNLGHGGASNKFIANRILEYDFQPQDQVVILWSSFARHCVFKTTDKADYLRLLPSDLDRSAGSLQHCAADKTATKAYYRHLYSDRDRIFENFLLINHAKLWLDKHAIANWHFCWQEHSAPKWNQTDLKFIDIDSLPKADEHHHPTRQGHAEIADKMLKEIMQA